MYLLYAQVNIISNVISFFRRKNAISEKNAINISDVDLLEMGVSTGTNLAKTYPFIKVTSSEEYWLDESVASGYRKNQERNEKILLGMLLLFLIAIVVFLLLITTGVIN